MLALYSIYVWAWWALMLALFGPFVVLALLILPTRLAFRVVQAWIRVAFFPVGIRVRAEGLERVDWSKAYVLMANHESLLDHFALCLVVPHHMVGVEKQENHKLPVYGAMAKAWGNVPIDRNDPTRARAAIAIAAQRLREGTSIIVMPEGTRSRDGQLAPFKKGGFHLAFDAGADIVPFTINGAWELSPGNDWRVRPGLVEIVFGEPIPTAGYTKEDMDVLIDRVRGAIVANMRDVEPAPAAA